MHALRRPAWYRESSALSRWHAGVYARFAIFLLAWTAISLKWFSWQALPFQALLAAAVLVHGLRRERLLTGYAEMETALTDVTERYRSLIETLPLATYIDRPGNLPGVEWVSPQIERMTSYEPDEWMSDSGLFRKVLHPDDRERVLAEMAEAAAEGRGVDHEFRMVRRDGSVVWVHDSAVFLDTPNGRKISGFIVDVTARREAERELERQNEQLRQLDRLKDEFVALVSHELRTPLTSISGYLELVREDENLSAEQLRFLDTIDRNAKRLQHVVGDLLFCAQVEAGKLSLDVKPLDLNAVVRDAVEAARPAAAGKSVELRSSLEELPELSGDQARLAQVVDNLVSNAIKFTPAGGAVSVETRVDETHAELVVADTGMGIPANELPSLFRRFFRTERATTNAIPGTGLGLAIAKAIVDGHDGEIAVESSEGAGTTFRVRLPLARVAE